MERNIYWLRYIGYVAYFYFIDIKAFNFVPPGLWFPTFVELQRIFFFSFASFHNIPTS